MKIVKVSYFLYGDKTTSVVLVEDDDENYILDKLYEWHNESEINTSIKIIESNTYSGMYELKLLTKYE